MLKLIWDYADTLCPFLTLILLLSAGKKFGKGYRILSIYLITTSATMGATNYLADRGHNNMYLYHCYSLFELIAMVTLISIFSQTSQRLARLGYLLYTVFWLANIIIWEGLLEFNSISGPVALLLIAIFCFRYYFLLIKRPELLKFQYIPSFWIVSGTLFHCIATILISASYKYDEWFGINDSKMIWKVQVVAIIIKFIMISTGIICSLLRPPKYGL